MGRFWVTLQEIYTIETEAEDAAMAARRAALMNHQNYQSRTVLGVIELRANQGWDWPPPQVQEQWFDETR